MSGSLLTKKIEEDVRVVLSAVKACALQGLRLDMDALERLNAGYAEALIGDLEARGLLDRTAEDVSPRSRLWKLDLDVDDIIEQWRDKDES